MPGVTSERAEALHPLHGLQPSEREPDELQSFIRTNAAEFLARQSGTRRGDDPEDLHKFRVATRRIRSLLRSTRGQLDDRVEGERLRAELKWLASLLGEVRDRDVLIEYLVGELDSLDGAPLGAFLELVDEERDQARRELVVALDSARFAELRAALGQPPGLREGETLRSAAKREYKRLRGTVEALDEDPGDEELHEARIRLKRARYAAEAAGVGGSYVDRAKELQEALGEHQDAVVAEASVRDLLARVRGTGRTAFAAGRLVERQQARKDHARGAWPSAWKRLRKAGDKAFS
jgi:CHAD domain-containing protein